MVPGVQVPIVAINIIIPYICRTILTQGSLQLLTCLAIFGVVLATCVENNALPHEASQGGLALLCIYVGGFVWSW